MKNVAHLMPVFQFGARHRGVLPVGKRQHFRLIDAGTAKPVWLHIFCGQRNEFVALIAGKDRAVAFQQPRRTTRGNVAPIRRVIGRQPETSAVLQGIAIFVVDGPIQRIDDDQPIVTLETIFFQIAGPARRNTRTEKREKDILPVRQPSFGIDRDRGNGQVVVDHGDIGHNGIEYFTKLSAIRGSEIAGLAIGLGFFAKVRQLAQKRLPRRFDRKCDGIGCNRLFALEPRHLIDVGQITGQLGSTASIAVVLAAGDIEPVTELFGDRGIVLGGIPGSQ